MRIIFLLLSLGVGGASGCASNEHSGYLDEDAFSRHFAGQESCMRYVNSTVGPASERLSAFRMPEEMRSWINDNEGRDPFARLVKRMQRETAELGVIDPRQEADQLAVTSRIFAALEEDADFRSSSCGADVREFFMESLYRGVGGEAAPVAEEIRRRGTGDVTEQRWVLLTALMAGSISFSSLSESRVDSD